MPNYIHDWQPQILDGVPGSPYYAADHAGDNGHNHFGFLDQQKAREVVQQLRANKFQVTEWAGDAGSRIGGHKDSGHYDGRSFDIPASQWSPSGPNPELEIQGMRRVNQFVQNFLLTKGVPLSVLPYAAPPKSQGPKGPTGAGQGPTPTGAQSLMGGDFSRTRFPQESFAAALPPAALSVITADAARGNAAPADWRTTPEGQAAADSNRSQQDTDARYWERADMETWAKAHSTLAKIAGKF